MVRLKDLLLYVSKINKNIFQFQYGAIERTPILIYSTFLEISIPVWCDWKVCKFFVMKPILLFQFQYGAIESKINKNIGIFQSTISIPVWCDWKTWPFTCAKCGSPYFNSSMVRLKDLFWNRDIDDFSYFNSSMVRLKAQSHLKHLNSCFEFQFQYGAIESRKNAFKKVFINNWLPTTKIAFFTEKIVVPIKCIFTDRTTTTHKSLTISMSKNV